MPSRSAPPDGGRPRPGWRSAAVGHGPRVALCLVRAPDGPEFLRAVARSARRTPLSATCTLLRAASGSWNPLLSLLVTNTSERSIPDFAIASPTSASLPYICAVSMWR